MRRVLEVGYTDVDPRALRWALGLPQQPALAVLHLEVGVVDVEVRLLGASHQVIATGAGFACSETVACGTATSALLPARAAELVPGGSASYELVSSVLTFHDGDGRRDPDGGVASYVARLDRALGERPDALVGVFPAPASAITAVLVEPTGDGVRWRTWHAYPEVATVVTTTATLAVA